MNKNDFPCAPNPAERRRAFIRNSRETARVVKRTLLVMALLAGMWYLFLLKTQSLETSTPNDVPPSVSEPQTSVER